MNIKSAVIYRLKETRKSVIFFYLVIIGLSLLMGLSAVSFVSSTMSISFGGMEFASAIFMLVLGLNSFRENFRMMLQNGLSRRTMFYSFAVSSLILSAVMSLVAELTTLIGELISYMHPNISIIGMMEQLYAARYFGGGHGLQMFAEGFLFFFCVFTAAIAGGYLITVLYYRMSKAGKVAVSVGVPTFLCFILPIFDAIVTHGTIYRFFGTTFVSAFGLDTGNPYIGMMSSLLLFAACMGCAWLLVRKAIIKD